MSAPGDGLEAKDCAPELTTDGHKPIQPVHVSDREPKKLMGVGFAAILVLL